MVATSSSESSHSQRPVRDRSPSSQNTMPRSAVSSLNASSRLTIEPAPAATTTPVSSSRVGVQPPGPWARPKTSRQAPKAPSAAAPSTPAAGRPAMIASSASTEAPPDTPSTYGSASGLRSRTCSIAPASASRPPTAKADKALGKRNSSTTSRAMDDCPAPKDCTISRTVSGRLPEASDSASTAVATASSSSSAAVRDRRRFMRRAPGPASVRGEFPVSQRCVVAGVLDRQPAM